MGTTTLGVFAANSRNNLPTAALLTGRVVRTTSTLTVVKEGDIFFYIKELRRDSITGSIIYNLYFRGDLFKICREEVLCFFRC